MSRGKTMPDDIDHIASRIVKRRIENMCREARINRLPPKPPAPPAPPSKRWPNLGIVYFSNNDNSLRILYENQEKIYELLKEIATKLY